MKANWITNKDGSIYHLGLHVENISETIITVGDQNRVKSISQYFDKLEFTKSNREFITHTGWIGNKRLTVISTGIGTDNIDIVFNELDALFNIDLISGQPKDKFQKIDFIRIGTSGTIQKDIQLDSFLASNYCIGLDGLMHFYNYNEFLTIQEELNQHITIPSCITKASAELLNFFSDPNILIGNTVTCSGFYAPQGRSVRIESKEKDWLEKLSKLNLSIGRITNLEMETSGIYGLSRMMGHQAISLNAILANRMTNEFSQDAEKSIDQLIRLSLEKIEKR
ncbi:MAG: nucleoside phosphorylase [Saprospiraceae bacterium]|nr:nucleoside phosphorylase [Saprospiraceae bacterium]